MIGFAGRVRWERERGRARARGGSWRIFVFISSECALHKIRQSAVHLHYIAGTVSALARSLAQQTNPTQMFSVVERWSPAEGQQPVQNRRTHTHEKVDWLNWLKPNRCELQSVGDVTYSAPSIIWNWKNNIVPETLKVTSSKASLQRPPFDDWTAELQHSREWDSSGAKESSNSSEAWAPGSNF
jgi:hypothetical protein